MAAEKRTTTPPRVVTRAGLAAQAAAAWRSQYPPGWLCDPHFEEIYQRLVALGPAPTPEQVDAVTGNTSWTTVPECDACGADAVLEVGELRECESATACLCAACVRAAAQMLDMVP